MHSAEKENEFTIAFGQNRKKILIHVNSLDTTIKSWYTIYKQAYKYIQTNKQANKITSIQIHFLAYKQITNIRTKSLTDH